MSDDLSIPNPSYRSNRAGRYGRTATRQRPQMDPDTKRLVLFAGGVGSVLLVLIGASVLSGHRSGQIPVVVAGPGPIRVKPENPGGMKIDAAENDVFSGGSDTANARLAPPAEAPDPKALKAAETAPVRHAPAARAAVGGAAPVVPPPVSPLQARVAEAPDTVPPPPPAPHRGRTAEASAVVPPPPRQVADTTRALPRSAEAKGTGDHKILVQLAAMRSDAEAKAEWERLRGKFRDLFEGRQLTISRIEHDGHAFWRVRTGGFADLAQAHAFCERLHAKDRGCSVAEF